MTRRSLEEGVGLTGEKVSDEARDFVHGDGKSKKKPSANPAPEATKTQKQYRQPYTVKLRSDVVESIHRISMFSEFRGEKLTKQAIVEEAIEQWVEQHKHLTEIPRNL